MKSGSLFLLFVGLLLVSLTLAHATCGTDHQMEYLRTHNPGRADRVESFARYVQEGTKNGNLFKGHHHDKQQLYRVPVVWHVLVDSEASRISVETIEQEMEWLNDWFSAKNSNYETRDPYFEDHIATEEDFNIQFYLAEYDPEGNPTNGILYIESPIAEHCTYDNFFNSSLGGSENWPSDQYYNVYSCNAVAIDDFDYTLLGFAYLPTGVGAFDDEPDGCVLSYFQLGDPYYSGSTISHESGHYLGVFHPFFYGVEGYCFDDFVEDTPVTDVPVFNYNSCNAVGGNQSEAIRCGNRVMVQNLMDYNYEECVAYFSKDQAARMRYILSSAQSERSSLIRSPALAPICLNYDCDGKTCGRDGCGGVCGKCGDDQFCNRRQTCVYTEERENIDCEGATVVKLKCDRKVTLTGYTQENYQNSIDSCYDGYYYPDFETHGSPLFYTFTPRFDGQVNITVWGENDDFDSMISVYSGSCSSLTCVAFNNNERVDYFSSALSVEVEKRTQYYLVVSSTYYMLGGDFSVSFEATAAPSSTPSVSATPSPSSTPSRSRKKRRRGPPKDEENLQCLSESLGSFLNLFSDIVDLSFLC